MVQVELYSWTLFKIHMHNYKKHIRVLHLYPCCRVGTGLETAEGPATLTIYMYKDTQSLCLFIKNLAACMDNTRDVLCKNYEN